VTKTAILLHNLGGPATPDDVQPFLENLFSDPEVIRLPFSRWLQRPLARFISRRRAPQSRENYRRIGGSPLLQWTQTQARGLEMGLREFYPDEDLAVLPAMRHSTPSIEDALHTAREQQVERIVSFSLYPQYSMTTVGSSENHLDRCLTELDWAPEVIKVSQWHDARDFHECWAWRIEKELATLDPEIRARTVIVYSAHGTPMSFVKRGDPYLDQVESTVEGINRQLRDHNEHTLAFQSRAGPVAWLRPYLDERLVELGSGGVDSVLVVPISFVSDHIETLHELDIETKHLAQSAGITSYLRCRSLNADPDFLGVLTRLAREALGGNASEVPSSLAERAAERADPRG
jgi:ferrochelatase